MKGYRALLVGCFICYNLSPLLAQQAPEDLFVQDSLKLVSSTFKFTEGASVAKNGDVFFTDQPNNEIWKYDISANKLSLFLANAGRSNGSYFDKKGQLITCADERGEIWSINPKGKVKILFANPPNSQLNGPNDLWIDANGGIYFTDPYYQRSYWTRTKPALDKEMVYYLPKGKKEAKIVAQDLVRPNGIVGSPDGKYLYVADAKALKTYRYRLNKDGSLYEKTLLINQGSDGMTVDELGNIYLTGDGVTIYNPEGKKIAWIEVKDQRTSNLCFAGKNRNLLFITARTAVYTIPMKVSGVE